MNMFSFGSLLVEVFFEVHGGEDGGLDFIRFDFESESSETSKIDTLTNKFVVMRIYFSGGEILLYVFASSLEDDVELFGLNLRNLLYLRFGFQRLEGGICSWLRFLVFSRVVLGVLKDPRKVRRCSGRRGIGREIG
jgi:hypothetical protein